MAGDIFGQLFGSDKNSDSEKVSKDIIESDASSFNRKKRVKPTLTSAEKKRTANIAEIIADVFFEKGKELKDDKTLATKISEPKKETPASAARQTTNQGKETKSKKGGFGGFGGFMKGAAGAAVGIAAAVAALALLVGVGPIPGVLENMAKIEWSAIGKAFVILGGLAVVGNYMKKGSVGILIGVAALAGLVGIPGVTEGVLHAFQDIEWGTLGKALAILGGIALAGKLVGLGSIGLLLGAGALAVLAGIPGVSKGVLHAFEEIEWGTIGKAFAVLVGIGVIGAVMGAAAPLLLAGAAAMGALGLALIPVAAAAYIFGKAMAALSPIVESFSKVIKAFGNLFTKVLNGTSKVLESFGVIITRVLTGVGKVLDSFGGIVTRVMTGVSKVLESAAVPLREVTNTLEQLSYLSPGEIFAMGPALVSLAGGLVALTGGGLFAGGMAKVGKFFGVDGPISNLIKLGENASEINKLGDSLDRIGDIDLDDINLSGDPKAFIKRVSIITSAMYPLIRAQERSVELFKQMSYGMTTLKPSKNILEFGASNIKQVTPPKNNTMEKLASTVSTLKQQLDTIITYSRATSNNTGNTVEAIKNMKPGSSTVLPLAGAGSRGSSGITDSGEDYNSRADYHSSAYSLA